MKFLLVFLLLLLGTTSVFAGTKTLSNSYSNESECNSKVSEYNISYPGFYRTPCLQEGGLYYYNLCDNESDCIQSNTQSSTSNVEEENAVNNVLGLLSGDNPYANKFSDGILEKLKIIIQKISLQKDELSGSDYNKLLEAFDNKLTTIKNKYPNSDIIQNLVGYLTFETDKLYIDTDIDDFFCELTGGCGEENNEINEDNNINNEYEDETNEINNELATINPTLVGTISGNIKIYDLYELFGYNIAGNGDSNIVANYFCGLTGNSDINADTSLYNQSNGIGKTLNADGGFDSYSTSCDTVGINCINKIYCNIINGATTSGTTATGTTNNQSIDTISAQQGTANYKFSNIEYPGTGPHSSFGYMEVSGFFIAESGKEPRKIDSEKRILPISHVTIENSKKVLHHYCASGIVDGYSLPTKKSASTVYVFKEVGNILHGKSTLNRTFYCQGYTYNGKKYGQIWKYQKEYNGVICDEGYVLDGNSCIPFNDFDTNDYVNGKLIDKSQNRIIDVNTYGNEFEIYGYLDSRINYTFEATDGMLLHVYLKFEGEADAIFAKFSKGASGKINAQPMYYNYNGGIGQSTRRELYIGLGLPLYNIRKPGRYRLLVNFNSRETTNDIELITQASLDIDIKLFKEQNNDNVSINEIKEFLANKYGITVDELSLYFNDSFTIVNSENTCQPSSPLYYAETLPRGEFGDIEFITKKVSIAGGFLLTNQAFKCYQGTKYIKHSDGSIGRSHYWTEDTGNFTESIICIEDQGYIKVDNHCILKSSLSSEKTFTQEQVNVFINGILGENISGTEKNNKIALSVITFEGQGYIGIREQIHITTNWPLEDIDSYVQTYKDNH